MSKRLPNGPGGMIMTEDRVRWLAMVEDAARRYDKDQYQEWLKLFHGIQTDAERIEHAHWAHAEIRRRRARAW